MTFATRQCVVCRAAFFPHVSDQWWCSDEHHETLKTLAAQRMAQESEVGGESEAEKARKAFAPQRLPGQRMPGERLPSELPTVDNVLVGVIAVLKAARKVPAPVEAYALLLQAQVALDRVVSAVEKGITQDEHDSGSEGD